jgi:hypothetical protein
MIKSSVPKDGDEETKENTEGTAAVDTDLFA